MTLKEIKDLWFHCYNEDLKTQYSGFYKRLEKLEKTIDKEEKNKLIKYDEFRKWLMTCPIPYEQEEILDFDDDSIFFYTSKNTDKFKGNKENKEG